MPNPWKVRFVSILGEAKTTAIAVLAGFLSSHIERRPPLLMKHGNGST